MKAVSKTVLSKINLLLQNLKYRGTGGISHNNRPFGFIPAFYDTVLNTVYISRHGNGHPAPVHLMECLPKDLLENRVITDKAGPSGDAVIVGFISGQYFYTREQAARILTGNIKNGRGMKLKGAAFHTKWRHR